MLVNIPVPWMVWVMYLIRRVTIRAFSSYSGYDQTQLSPEFLASNCADKLRYYVAMEGQSWGNGKVASHYGGCYHAVLLPNLLFEPPVYS